MCRVLCTKTKKKYYSLVLSHQGKISFKEYLEMELALQGYLGSGKYLALGREWTTRNKNQIFRWFTLAIMAV